MHPSQSYDENNIFAKILRGEMPCHKIYEDDDVLAFLDIMPRTRGHTLVIPKRPAVNLLDIDPDELCRLMRAVHRLAPLVATAMGADGFSIHQFNEAAAGQEVFHIHFHIMPRFEGVPLKHAGGPVEQEKILVANAEKIRAEIEKAAG